MKPTEAATTTPAPANNAGVLSPAPSPSTPAPSTRGAGVFDELPPTLPFRSVDLTPRARPIVPVTRLRDSEVAHPEDFTARAMAQRVAGLVGRGVNEAGTLRLAAALAKPCRGGVDFDVAGGEG